jgi:hypothetical protein
LDPNALGGSFAVQTARPAEWFFVVGSFALFAGQLALQHRLGTASDARGVDGVMDRVESGAERVQGVPGWAAVPVSIGLWALLTAFIGFVWDVGWHADTGRDKELFTVPHVLILVGLGGLVLTALVAGWSATRNHAPTGWRIRRWHVPYASVALFVIGAGALLGFPLDDAWHAAYGIDVTMWSPTHLLMIGGASLSPLALWLLLSEAGAPGTRKGRALWAFMAGVVLVGLSTLQLEFDMGIPQWQAFYHPLLIAVAGGISLVAARAAIGRGGALVATAVFVTLRILMALLVGGILGRSLPHFPLYLGAAVSVEAAFWLLRGRGLLWQALASGVLVGTAGLAAEAAWVGAWFPYPWQSGMLAYTWMFVAGGLLAAVVGAAMGSALLGRRSPVRAALVALALVGMFGLLLVNIGSRHADPARVTLGATTVGTPYPLVNRDGVATISRNVALTIKLDPQTAAQGADFFEVMAWQGGPDEKVRHVRLVATGPGEFRTEGAVPTGGTWKSLAILHRGNVVEAVPVAMPPDPGFNLPALDGVAAGTTAFAPSSHYLMREFKDGVAWPAIVITGLFGVVLLAWVTSTALAYRAFAREESMAPHSARGLVPA